jgi:hypothetical protein
MTPRRFLAAALCIAAVALATPFGASGGAAAAPAQGAPLRVTLDDGSKSWSVRPAGPDGKADARTHYTLQATPGTTLTDRVLVTNTSKVAVSFSIYGTDAFNTPTGAFDLLAADKPPSDLGAWLSFPYKAISVSAGGTVAVPFQVVVPPTATPGDHAGGVLVSLFNQANTDSGKVNVDTRVAVRVYLRVPGNLIPRLGVSAVSASYTGTANPFGTGKISVTYTVNNPGNIRLRAHPTITVSGIFGTVATLKPDDIPELLPNSHVTFTSTMGGVFPAGPLTVTVRLAPYADPLQPVGQNIPAASGSASLWAVPWTLLLLVIGVLVLGVLAWLLSRRRRVRQLDEAIRRAGPDGGKGAKATRTNEGKDAEKVPAGTAGRGGRA